MARPRHISHRNFSAYAGNGKRLKNLWRILNSENGLFYWAAESRVGAVCVTLLLIAAHVSFGFGLSEGRSGYSFRDRDPVLFWIEIGLWGVGLVWLDMLLIWSWLRERDAKLNGGKTTKS